MEENKVERTTDGEWGPSNLQQLASGGERHRLMQPRSDTSLTGRS